MNLTLWGVYSVWHRHATRYRNSWKVNCIPPVSEPLVYLIAFGYGMGPLVGELTYLGKEVDYFHFIAPGMIAVGLLFQSFFEGAYGTYIRIRYQMTWQAMLTSPITFDEVFVGDLLWGATRGAIAGVLTALTAVLLGVYPLLSFFAVLPLLLLGCLLFSAMGLMAAGYVKSIDHLNIPVFLLVVPMFVFCGTYFPRDVLPTFLAIIASVLPLSAIVDLLRWPLGVPEGWEIRVVVIFAWTGLFIWIARRKLYNKIYK